MTIEKEVIAIKDLLEMKEMIYQEERKCELLYKGKYKGFKFYIMNLGTHPTAYVEIPKDHELFEVDYDNIEIKVHGGLTYSSSSLKISEDDIMVDSWFIGWDHFHFGDYTGYNLRYKSLKSENEEEKKWTTLEIVKECFRVIEQLDNEDILLKAKFQEAISKAQSYLSKLEDGEVIFQKDIDQLEEVIDILKGI